MPNVLVDRHHSGLFHSWQLMARRFGWTLYTPIGHDWWDQWYWSFGRSTYNDDRLAQQFLMGTPGVDGLGPLIDGEFPAWPINGVMLEEAKGMDWAFVIATVPDNEHGFHRFAQETGAQYVVGIGNTGQSVEWSLDPIALSSSEMPLVGKGVVYHQPMDPIKYHPIFVPELRHTAASFVNCMPQMGSCWDQLEAASGRGLRVPVYGINGPEGVIKPYAAMVNTMSLHGWGWHDKAQGDGFGHVIHSWAAVGRPLIGHASHYRGKLAERFWQHGVTCLDLDRISIEEAVRVVQTIKPERHESMCQAIRAEFDKIDFEGEADQIADLLGLRVAA